MSLIPSSARFFSFNFSILLCRSSLPFGPDADADVDFDADGGATVLDLAVDDIDVDAFVDDDIVLVLESDLYSFNIQVLLLFELTNPPALLFAPVPLVTLLCTLVLALVLALEPALALALDQSLRIILVLLCRRF